MTTGHGAKMNRKQEQALAALLIEPTIMAAANRVGIGEKTLRRWLQYPHFDEAYRQAKSECFDRAREELKYATVAAVDALTAALKDESPSIRLRASIAILELASKAHDEADLQTRLERLESEEARSRAVRTFR